MPVTNDSLKRIRVYPYKPASASAQAIADHLGAKRLRHENSAFRGRHTDVIVNWGASNIRAQNIGQGLLLNSTIYTELAQNKLVFFVHLRDTGNPGALHNIPQFFTSIEDAAKFMEDTGKHVMCRTVLTGHSGRGIVYATTPEELVNAPLYVEYIKKASEFRVHFVAGEVTKDPFTAEFLRGRPLYSFVQRKARRKDIDDAAVDWKVRNLKGGFIYANDPQNVGDVPVQVLQEAEKAFRASCLDFGAVDVIYNKKHKKAYVLEINTAPGITGRTGEFYKESLAKTLNDYKP